MLTERREPQRRCQRGALPRASGRPSWAARPSARARPALPGRRRPRRRARLLAMRGRGARRPFGRRRVRELYLVKDVREAKPLRRTESRKQPSAGFRPLAAPCAAVPGAFAPRGRTPSRPPLSRLLPQCLPSPRASSRPPWLSPRGGPRPHRREYEKRRQRPRGDS